MIQTIGTIAALIAINNELNVVHKIRTIFPEPIFINYNELKECSLERWY